MNAAAHVKVWGQPEMMTVEIPKDSKARIFLGRCLAVGASGTAVALATTAAYWIFQGLRRTRFDNVLDGVYRFLRDVIRTILDLDPVVSAWAFPLVLGLFIVIGMLIHRHFDK